MESGKGIRVEAKKSRGRERKKKMEGGKKTRVEKDAQTKNRNGKNGVWRRLEGCAAEKTEGRKGDNRKRGGERAKEEKFLSFRTHIHTRRVFVHGPVKGKTSKMGAASFSLFLVRPYLSCHRTPHTALLVIQGTVFP